MKRMPPPTIRVSFDTNTYSPITNPQLIKIITAGWRPLTRDRLLSKLKRIGWWYLHICIRRGRIIAAIPEPAFAAEVFRNEDRIELLLALGTPKAANLPRIPESRRNLIQKALGLGFRVQHGSRIGYGEFVGVKEGHWAPDDVFSVENRQKRFSDFIRHFSDYPKEKLCDLGETLSVAHKLARKYPQLAQAAALNKISLDRYLWKEGLKAEQQSQLMHVSLESFQNVVRDKISDWADFDIVATHYAYGYDLLCTEDTGKSSPNSIFGSAHASDVVGKFGIKTISAMNLAILCLPLMNLRKDAKKTP